MALSLAYPPYPNDTYVFSAWSNGLLNAAPRVAVSLDHVEALNVAAFASRYTVTKASYGAMPLLLGDYRMLRAGSSFGLETGPLLVGRPDANGTMPTLESLPREARIAIRGPMTTCHLLLQLALGRSPIVEIMRPDRIIGAVARGEVAAGVLMAETCYPYEEAGLRCISDLGQWWRQETGRPTPVTGVLVRRDVPLDSARDRCNHSREPGLRARARTRDRPVHPGRPERGGRGNPTQGHLDVRQRLYRGRGRRRRRCRR